MKFPITSKIIGNRVFFYTNEFSNWNRCKFIDHISGIEFHTTEQAFMWYKAYFFRDTKIMNELVSPMHPKDAKALGREVKNYDDKSWEAVRLGFMVYVNYLKFSQNKVYRELLLNTSSMELVEASPYDKIWGIGLGLEEDDYILDDRNNWNGQNLLGQALMKVRRMLNEGIIS